MFCLYYDKTQMSVYLSDTNNVRNRKCAKPQVCETASVRNRKCAVNRVIEHNG
jgi:hypothetical protein